MAGWLLALCIAAPAVASTDFIEISGMTFVASRNSRNEVVVWAEKARVDMVSQTAHLEQIHVSFSSEGSRLEVELRCATGDLDLATNAFRLEGNVEGRTRDGWRFEAEWIAYDDATSLLYSDAPVVIRERGGLYEGGGLRYELTTRRLRLLRGARVVRQP